MVMRIQEKGDKRNHPIPLSGSEGSACVSKIHVEHFDLLSSVRSDK